MSIDMILAIGAIACAILALVVTTKGDTLLAIGIVLLALALLI